MEISILTKDSIKIKGKNASFVVDPTALLRAKTQADAVLIVTKFKEYDTSKIEEQRVIIDASGEYEVGGIKITGFKVDSYHLNYNILIDGIELLLTSSSSLIKQKEPMRDYNIIALQTDLVLDESIIVAFSPQMVVLFGEKGEEMFNALGTSKKSKTSKVMLKKEQLPEEMEAVLLE